MDHRKVYPFTVYLPRYACWRKYVQVLLSQLKACPNCRGAADRFITPVVPNAYKLPNGKILIFSSTHIGADHHQKSVPTSQANKMAIEPWHDSNHKPWQTCSDHELVEYEVVSIEPNCPRHGKYSRTAWLRKQSTKLARPISYTDPGQQIVQRPRDVQNHNEQTIDKRAYDTDRVGRSLISKSCKPLEKCQPNTLDKVVVRSANMEVFVLNKHKSDNMGLKGLKESVVICPNGVTREDSHQASVLIQKEHNILCMDDRKKVSSSGRTSNKTDTAEKLVARTAKLRKEMQFFGEDVMLPLYEQQNCKGTSMRMQRECGAPLAENSMVNKGLEPRPIQNFEHKKSDVRKGRCGTEMVWVNSLRPRSFGDVNTERTKNSEECELRTLATPPKGTSVTTTFDSKVTLQGFKNHKEYIYPFKDVGKVDAYKTAESYASNYRRTCFLKRLNGSSFNVLDGEVESTLNEGTKPLLQGEFSENVRKAETKLDHTWQSSGRMSPKQQNIDVAVKTEDDSHALETSIVVQTRSSNERKELVASEVFDLREFEHTKERLKRIADTARALQFDLEDTSGCDRPSIEGFHLVQAQIVEKKEARDWLMNTAIEKALNDLPAMSEAGRVRHLVKAYESIK